jgi:hypothetical protein
VGLKLMNKFPEFFISYVYTVKEVATELVLNFTIEVVNISLLIT